MKASCLFSLIILAISLAGCKSVDDSVHSWQYSGSKYYNYNGEVNFTRREWYQCGIKDSMLNEKLTILNVKDTSIVLASFEDRVVQFEFKGTAENTKQIKRLVKSCILEFGKDLQ